MRLCSIASGSSGNCIYVGSDRTHLLVDTGISRKRIDEGLHTLGIKGEELAGILITHEHSDHIQGLGVFSRKYGIPVYATKGTLRGITEYRSLGRMPEGLLREIHTDTEFDLGDLKIRPFSISHDAYEPSGYRIACGQRLATVRRPPSEMNSCAVSRSTSSAPICPAAKAPSIQYMTRKSPIDWIMSSQRPFTLWKALQESL